MYRRGVQACKTRPSDKYRCPIIEVQLRRSAVYVIPRAKMALAKPLAFFHRLGVAGGQSQLTAITYNLNDPSKTAIMEGKVLTLPGDLLPPACSTPCICTVMVREEDPAR
jgi:hypothetical protein